MNSPQVHFIQAFAPVAVSVESILYQFNNAIIMVHGADLDHMFENAFILNGSHENAVVMTPLMAEVRHNNTLYFVLLSL